MEPCNFGFPAVAGGRVCFSFSSAAPPALALSVCLSLSLPQGRNSGHHSYSPGTAGPDGSSHTVGSVCSHAAQFTSSTLEGNRTALRLQETTCATCFPQERGPGGHRSRHRDSEEGGISPPSCQGRILAAVTLLPPGSRVCIEGTGICPFRLFTATWVALNIQRRV